MRGESQLLGIPNRLLEELASASGLDSFKLFMRQTCDPISVVGW
jgi:hypothetical protein